MRARFSVVLAVVAALGMSTVAATSAFAEEFGSSGSGSLESSGGKQTYTVENTAKETLKVVCEKVKDKGSVSGTKNQTQTVEATYEGCEANLEAVENIQADYEFNAGTEKVAGGPAHGTVTILKEIKVETKPVGAGVKGEVCTVTVPKQGPLAGIEYVENTNHNKAITINALVSGIEASAKGTLKPCNNLVAKGGKYTGKSEAWLAVTGGTLSLLE